MPNINSIASMSDFLQNEKDGWISIRSHFDDPNLVVANYTPAQAWRNQWDAITLSSRGLIFKLDTGEIIARPFKKFFNANQPGTEHIDTSGATEVTNKEDGSMGILYKAPDGRFSVSTRGSMSSTQAQHATEVFRDKYENNWVPDNDYSFIFEIIFKAGRIVLNYGDLDDLILLGAVNKKTGVSVDRVTLESFGYPGPIAHIYDFPNYLSVFEAEQESNREGFVVRFVDSDERLKIKFDEYLQIHRLMFDLSPKRIWSLLSDGVDIDEWLMQLPDEFAEDAKGWRDTLIKQHKDVMATVKTHYNQLPADLDRPSVAALVKKMDVPAIYKSYVFLLVSGHDDKKVSDAIWDGLEPKKHPKVWK